MSVINKLSAHQLLKRGFYIECSACGSKEWYSLGEADEFIVCPGCSNKFPLPVEEKKNIETKWRYRLNSLVNKCVDQDLFIALATLGFLENDITTSCNYCGVELIKDNKVITDLDFIFIENSKVVVGECKTNDSFTKKRFQ